MSRLSHNNEIVPDGRRRLTAADAIVPLEAPPVAHDRRGGELHPSGNPHFLSDPRRAGQVAAAIARRLALLAPSTRGRTPPRWSSFGPALAADEARWKEQLAPFRGEAVVTEHDPLPHFLDWAGLVTAGHLEPEPGLPPSAAQLNALAREMKLHHVRAIVSEESRDGRAAEILARLSGAREARIPATSAPRPRRPPTRLIWT